jgi:hypothetical protein
VVSTERSVATTGDWSAAPLCYEAAVPVGGRAAAASDRAFATSSQSVTTSHWKKVKYPSVAKPQLNLGMSPAKALRRKVFEEKKVFSGLGVFAPSRENDPTPRTFDVRNI